MAKKKRNPTKRKRQTSVPKKVLEGHRRLWGGTIPSGALAQLKKEYARGVRNPAPRLKRLAKSSGWIKATAVKIVKRRGQPDAVLIRKAAGKKTKKQVGNLVTYEIPAEQIAGAKLRRRRIFIAALSIGALAVVAAFVAVSLGVASPSVASVLAGLGSVLVGANTIAYEWPTSGATPPTAPVMSKHQQMTAIITGDGAATTFTVTHNMNISASDLTGGFPEVFPEVILAAGNTALPVITSKTANTVVFSCTAFTGAGLRIRIRRPLSNDK
jgi:hypothetical protein